jgi:hypothetical protein
MNLWQVATRVFADHPVLLLVRCFKIRARS